MTVFFTPPSSDETPLRSTQQVDAAIAVDIRAILDRVGEDLLANGGTPDDESLLAEIEAAVRARLREGCRDA
jgi:hypothetical protein